MAESLGPDTRFWLVSPSITLRGITGLETLLGGVYIGMEPGPVGTRKTEYAGLDRAPTVGIQSNGTPLVLNAENLGSIDVGSPVFYRQIKAGEVTGYSISPDKKRVDVEVFIFSPYDQNIRTNSRFWNASGFELEATTTGVSARMESLTSLLIGGIAFSTDFDEIGFPLNNKGTSDKARGNKTSFKMYSSYKRAHDDTATENKLLYAMRFDDSLHGLSVGAEIQFNGVKVGHVENILLKLNDEDRQLYTQVNAAIYINRFSELNSRDDAELLLQNMVEAGLRARLKTDSLITGAQYVALEMMDEDKANQIALAAIDYSDQLNDNLVLFPTSAAPSSLLNFDPSGITDGLEIAISSANRLLSSEDVGRTLKSLAQTSDNIAKVTTELNKRGISGEIMSLFKETGDIADGLGSAIKDARAMIKTLDGAASNLQADAQKAMIDARVALQGAGKAATTIDRSIGTLQKDASTAIIDARVAIQNAGKTAKTIGSAAGRLQKDLSAATVDARVVMQRDVSPAIGDARVALQNAGKAAKTIDGSVDRLSRDLKPAIIDARVLMQKAGKAASGLDNSAGRLQKDLSAITADARGMLKRDISPAIGDARVAIQKAGKAAGTIDGSVGKLSKSLDPAIIDARVMMQKAGKTAAGLSGTANKLQKDIERALVDVRKLAVQLKSSTGKLEKDSSKALIDARVMMQRIGKAVTALKKDTSRTLHSVNKAAGTLDRSMKSTLSEDSALQYRFQQLINDLGEAANSFSVLADTLQRKPNSLILGK